MNFLASILPSLIGTGIGATFGSGGGGGGNFLTGNPDQFKRLKLLNKDQQRGLKDLFRNPINQSQGFQTGQNFLTQLLQGKNEPNYENAQKPYLENFQQNIVPGLYERFGAQGTGAGALSSSGFQNSLAQAGRGLQSDLAAMTEGLKGNYRNQQLQGAGQSLQYAQQPYNNLLNALGIRSFENAYQPGSEGLLGGIGSGFGSGFGDNFGNSFGNWLFK
jgi:hypothetical protein